VWWWTLVVWTTREVEVRELWSEASLQKLVQRSICEGKQKKKNWVPVIHTCIPSYSGGRDQEDHGLKPAQANSSWDSTSKKPNTK
jgi:hypothetical protein